MENTIVALTDNLIVVAGHNGSLQLRCGAHSAWFYRGQRTLTGRRDKFGRCRCMTASEVRRLLQPGKLLKKPYDYIVYESDKWGFFGKIETTDLFQAVKHNRCQYLPTLPVQMLRQVCGEL